jgi:excisionase family DNA binding protein
MTIAELLEREDTLPPTVSVEEAGRLLGLSRRSAYRAVERGELPVLRFGRRLLVPTAKLLVMLGVRPGPPVHGGHEREQATG